VRNPQRDDDNYAPDRGADPEPDDGPPPIAREQERPRRRGQGKQQKQPSQQPNVLGRLGKLAVDAADVPLD
jgi:hypothetical protein